MEEAVNVLCDRMKLTEIKDEEIMVDLESLKDVVSKGEQCLLAKLFTTRPYHRGLQNHSEEDLEINKCGSTLRVGVKHYKGLGTK